MTVTGSATAQEPYPDDNSQTEGSNHDGPGGPGGAIGEDCTKDRWLAPVTNLIVHTAAFGGSADQQAQLIQAINDVNDEFNRIGGSQAYVSPVQTTILPFSLDLTGSNADQTIHVGLAPDLPEPEGTASEAVGSTKRAEWDYDCQLIRTVNIGFLSELEYDWNYSTHQDDGVANTTYYETGKRDQADNVYFRISYLHELLHAFGLEHSSDTYAFTNYGERPWANRPGADSIRPLPADIRALRSMYPAGTGRSDVALLNTWFDPADTSVGAARQKMLCNPSQARIGAPCSPTSAEPVALKRVTPTCARTTPCSPDSRSRTTRRARWT